MNTGKQPNPDRRQFISSFLGFMAPLLGLRFRKPKVTKQLDSYQDAVEMAVLGSMMEDPAALSGIIQSISSKHFQIPGNAVIFIAIAKLHSKGHAVSLEATTDVLMDFNLLEDVGGRRRLEDMIEGVPNPTNARHYADTLVSRAT
jgi:replicative DNA helicase